MKLNNVGALGGIYMRPGRRHTGVISYRPPYISFYAVAICPAAGQGIINGLNARQSKIFTEFPLKDSFKLLSAIDVCLEPSELIEL